MSDPLRVQSASGVSSTSATLAAPATAGNLLLYIIADNNVSQTLTPAGFTTVRTFNGGGIAVRANIVVAIKVAEGGEQTITNGGGVGPRPSTIVAEYTNVDAASIVSAISQGWAPSEVSPFTATVTSPAANSLALVIYAGEATSTVNFSPHPAADTTVVRRAAATNAPTANWPGVGLAESNALFAFGEAITLGWTTTPADNRKSVVVIALPPAGGGPATIEGDASTALDDTTVASAGVVDNLTGIGGDAAAALDGIAIDSQGTLAISAGGTMILDTVGLSGQGSIGITAAAAVGLDAIALSASGIVLAGIAGSAAVTLDNITLAAGGALSTPESNGSAAIALADLVLAAAGEIGITAQAALALDDTTVASSSQSIIGGQATNVLEQLTLAADGSLEIRAAFDVVLEDTGLASAGISTPLDPIAGELLVTLDPTTLSAGAVQVREGNAAITLADLSLRGQGFLEDAYDPGAIVYRVDRLETSFALLEVRTHPTRRGIMKTVEAKQGDAIEIYAAPEPVQDLTGWQCRVRVAADKTANPLIDELVLGRNGSNTAVEDRLLTDVLAPGNYHLMTRLWKASTNQSREIHQRLRIETSGH